MRISSWLLLIGLPALSLACSPQAQYFHITAAPAPVPTGVNCPAPTSTTNYANVDTGSDWALYPAPSSKYLLEGAASSLLVGTASGSSYSFTGQEVATQMGTTSVTVTTTDRVTFTTSATGLTGNISQEIACSSSDGKSCTGIAGNTDGQDFDCTSSSAILGTVLTTETASVINTSGATLPAPPNP